MNTLGDQEHNRSQQDYDHPGLIWLLLLHLGVCYAFIVVAGEVFIEAIRTHSACMFNFTGTDYTFKTPIEKATGLRCMVELPFYVRFRVSRHIFAIKTTGTGYSTLI